MKRITYKISLLALAAGMATSCSSDFLDVKPQGQLAPSQLETPSGVEASLISSYTMLNGSVSGTWGTYAAAPSHWLWGDVAADNAHKGSDPGDQPDLGAIETHNPITANSSLSEIWDRRFEGILRTNNTLKLLRNTPELAGAPRGTVVQAEARFLRAHYYFDLWRLFKFVPYIDDNTENPAAVANDKDIIADIEADMLYAQQNLPATKHQNQVGRADKQAANAYLGKIYLYQKKYAQALPLFQEVINSKPDLVTLDFRDNFDVTRKNGPEAIFDVQASVQDGTGGDRGNVGDMLNNPFLGSLPVGCCGFFSPSFDLANAYRVDANGLPDFQNHHATYFPSSFDAGFQVPTQLALDPRLDYTLGRQGIPYRDWGIMAGNSWIRNPGYGGPFVPYKNVTDAAAVASHTVPGTTNVNDLNIHLIRLADVYLMAAECYVQTNDLPAALALVNKVRERAAKLPAKQITVAGNKVNAANYKVNGYASFPDAGFALQAIQWERRLELALEGHRFYDLQRWGILQNTLANYAAYESKKLSYVVPIPENEFYYPIPQAQIDRSKGVLKQH
jgi:tetratricopeptide (TPR) repeat protein